MLRDGGVVADMWLQDVAAAHVRCHGHVDQHGQHRREGERGGGVRVLCCQFQ